MMDIDEDHAVTASGATRSSWPGPWRRTRPAARPARLRRPAAAWRSAGPRGGLTAGTSSSRTPRSRPTRPSTRACRRAGTRSGPSGRPAATPRPWSSCGAGARGPRRSLVSVAVAVVAPLLWLSVAYPLEDGMMVIDRSATLLLHHGSPYLTAAQVTSWLSYNPYLPVMTLFGLPARGRPRRPGREPGVWLALGTVAVLAAAFWIAVPHRPVPRAAATRCWPRRRGRLARDRPQPGRDHHRPARARVRCCCRWRWSAFPRSEGQRARTVGSGIALGVACDLKSTAWLAVPVMAAMFACRDGARVMWRFLAARCSPPSG